jgi:glycosyltransferase involved in cell wall biosynthesis
MYCISRMGYEDSKKEVIAIPTTMVSCIIPSHNRPVEVERAIDSVINQTYEGHLEIVVVSDSGKPIERELPNNRSLLYLPVEKCGAPKARNIGIKESHGQFIAFLDDDDEWYPTKIDKQMKLISEWKNCPLVVCWSLDERRTPRIVRLSSVINHRKLLKSFRVSSTSGFLFRRYPLELHKGFDESLPASQEYDLAIRISKNHDIRCVKEVLMVQHKSQNQISSDWRKKVKGVIGIYRKHHEEYATLDHLKTFGLITLFTFGSVLGNKVYDIIISIKEGYD